MTTNKPEVVGFAWSFRQAREVVAARSTFVNQLRNDGVDLEPLIRLSDYDALQAERNMLEQRLDELADTFALCAQERMTFQLERDALQAECETLRKHLQSMIDQTTPLEPVPGNPMWSRRIQLDEVIAERDQLRAECEKLRKDAERYRWLRDPCSGAEHVVMYGRGDYGRGLMAYTMLDEAIDAAMETPK